ncbi:hypothetical protein JCM10296v2_005632 [Rhodotorula toruloides]
MAISAPIVPSALSSQPLLVSLPLADLLPPTPPPPSSTSEFGGSTDVFDELDSAAGCWDVENGTEDEGEAARAEEAEKKDVRDEEVRGSRQSTAPLSPLFASALADRHHVLYPHGAGDISAAADEGDWRNEQDESGLPPWMKETSGKVTAMVTATVKTRTARRRSGSGIVKDWTTRLADSSRVAVGCEDGTVWVFAPATPLTRQQVGAAVLGPKSPPPSNGRRLSREAFLSPDDTTAHVTESSSRPPLSASNKSPRLVSSPRLSSRLSSSSLASLATNATARTKRIPSLTSASPAPSTTQDRLTCFELVRTHSRPRKASATVSLSTSAATPATASHTHSSAASVSSTSLNDLDMPTSPSPPLSLDPLSPTSSSIPHFVFSSSSLSSRKEGSSTPDTPHKRSHSRAKDSIATGIGLWETSSSASLLSPDEDLEQPPLDAAGEAPVIDADGMDEVLKELVPMLKVRTGGTSEVAGLAVVAGLECTDASEGDALLVLRRDGHLSLVSLLDGRVFASCELADSGSSRATAGFSDLLVCEVAQTPFALCIARGSPNTAVSLNLRSFTAGSSTRLGQNSPAKDTVAVVDLDGLQRLVYASAPASTGPNELYARVMSLEAAQDERQPTRLSFSDKRRIELPDSLQSVSGIRKLDSRILAYGSDGISVLDLANEPASETSKLQIKDVQSISVAEDGRTVIVAVKQRVSFYDFFVDAPSETFRLSATAKIDGCCERLASHSSGALFVHRFKDGDRIFSLFGTPSRKGGESTDASDTTILYAPSSPNADWLVTKTKELDAGVFLVGYNTGAVAVLSLGSAKADSASVKSELFGAITLLDVVELAGRQVVIAGTSSGNAAAWNLSDWDCLGRWTLSASPVKDFAFISTSETVHAPPALNGSVAFISANSPVAFVSLFPPLHLFTLPGTRSAVELIALSQTEILVLYEQGLARVCDIASRELRRSMDRRTTESVLAEDAWSTWFRTRRSERSDDAPIADTITLDLRQLLDDAARSLPWSPHTKQDTEAKETPDGSPNLSKDFSDANGTSASIDHHRIARRLLAILAAPFNDVGLKDILNDLEIETLPAIVGVCGADIDAQPMINVTQFDGPWCISASLTARRLLQLVCLLRLFLNYPDLERVASEAIVYYASCLAGAVGPSFVPPSLDVLGSFWLDKNAEVQQAARSLFGTYLASMEDEDILALVESWRNHLPAERSSEASLHRQADHAFLLIGLVAIDRYNLLSSTILKDVASSIAAYLEDEEHPYHQATATELCSRGFAIWQNYVDAMALVRDLFALAIGRNPATPGDLRILARNATLHVASSNTPLFMTTLIFDILNAPTAQARNATLKLLGFVIRKKPLILYSNLPRLVETVVKSLDPKISSLRETVQQTATFILNELVRTFPSVAFHGSSQRLAVGTHEGAAIVYDLRTATRLYVLEGHKHPVTALSWSPDGHRLVTVSLEENRVIVWRVSGGIFGMFMSGAPARQGSSSSATPYKTYDFHVGGESLMTLAATLEWVVFDWPAERTVRLQLRETALNFGV